MFPREYRLRKEMDIQALFKKGRSVFDALVGVKSRKNGLPHSRVAIVVGTKVHKRAVRRNRIRRQIRSVVEQHWSHIRPGMDMAIIALPATTTATFQEVKSSTLNALKRAGVLNPTPPAL